MLLGATPQLGLHQLRSAVIDGQRAEADQPPQQEHRIREYDATPSRNLGRQSDVAAAAEENHVIAIGPLLSLLDLPGERESRIFGTT